VAIAAPGGPTAFYDRVHAHGIYDLELDTSKTSPRECALQIKTVLESKVPPGAFGRLAEIFAWE
jgi:chloramphenicol 3-O phosphotransferase